MRLHSLERTNMMYYFNMGQGYSIYYYFFSQATEETAAAMSAICFRSSSFRTICIIKSTMTLPAYLKGLTFHSQG